MGAIRYAVVVPTIGRPSLARLLGTLADQDTDGGRYGPVEVIVSDDRPVTGTPLAPAVGRWPQRVVRSGGRGPASARNLGWQVATAEWVVFLDDGLEHARWATADMAYRRTALVQVHGFDERFSRAYREDADLALRIRHAGWQLVRGGRRVRHPVRPADPWTSVRAQAGNVDDALMRGLHGPGWRLAADVPEGRFTAHALTTAAAISGAVAALAGHRRLAAPALLGWAALTGDLL